MKSKKADVNWIIVSFVLALIVLAILSYIFWSQTKKSSESAEALTCAARGGTCGAAAQKEGYYCFYRLGCPTAAQAGDYCCIPKEQT